VQLEKYSERNQAKKPVDFQEVTCFAYKVLNGLFCRVSVGGFNVINFMISVPAEGVVTACKVHNREPGLTMVLKYNPDVNACDVYGRLPIHTVANNGNTTILQKLVCS
jgi:hypothetical protein